jgi:hypothetical protein
MHDTMYQTFAGLSEDPKQKINYKNRRVTSPPPTGMTSENRDCRSLYRRQCRSTLQVKTARSADAFASLGRRYLNASGEKL